MGESCAPWCPKPGTPDTRVGATSPHHALACVTKLCASGQALLASEITSCCSECSNLDQIYTNCRPQWQVQRALWGTALQHQADLIRANRRWPTSRKEATCTYE